MLYPTQDLLLAIDNVNLTETQLEGIARLFRQFGPQTNRPNDLNLLSKPLKERLLEHCLKSNDKFKIRVAERAFGQ